MSLLPPSADRQAARVSDALSGPAGEELYARLLEFAERQIRSRRWCIRTFDQAMPGGKSAADVVNETVHAATADPADRRRRNIPEGVDSEHGLKCIIESKVNHAAESFENRNRRDHVATNAEGEKFDRLDSATPFWEPGTAELPDDELAAMGEDCARFIEFAKTDYLVQRMLMLIRDKGIDKPVERIARELSVGPAEVLLARKRLRRLVRKFQRTEIRP